MTLTLAELDRLLNLAYLDARQNERNRNAQLRFELDLENNIRNLRTRLWKREYTPDPPICFVIDTPREIFAPQFQDRVVSHLLFNMIAPLFDPLFIYDSYSCRKEKGTLFGIERLEHHLRSCTENYTKRAYVLCLDISGYFMNINKQTLYNILITEMNKHKNTWEKVIDYNFVDYLFRAILFRDPTKGAIKLGNPNNWNKLPSYKSLFNALPGIGLTIGDITSQLFSNIYMDPTDQYIKRDLGCKHYGRYVDDLRIVHNDKNFLHDISIKIGNFINTNLGLSLNTTKTRIIRADKTVDFLGARIRKGRRYVAPSTAVNFAKKAYVGQDISILNSYIGYLRHFRSDKILEKLLPPIVNSGAYKFSNGSFKFKY